MKPNEACENALIKATLDNPKVKDAVRQIDEAQARFESCLEISTEDGPSRLFVERIAHLRSTPPSSNWDGVWHISEKP